MPLILLQMHDLIAAFAWWCACSRYLACAAESHALNGIRVITGTLQHTHTIKTFPSPIHQLYRFDNRALHSFHPRSYYIHCYILYLSVHNMPKRQLVAGKKGSTLSTDHVTRPPVPEQVQKSLIQVGMKVYLAPSSSSSLFVISLLRTLLNSY